MEGLAPLAGLRALSLSLNRLRGPGAWDPTTVFQHLATLDLSHNALEPAATLGRDSPLAALPWCVTDALTVCCTHQLRFDGL